MNYPSRSLVATLVVAVLASTAAGCGKSDASAPTQVAARVNKSEISVHQINNVLQRQSGLQPEQAEAAGRQVLERLIDQELAVQKAKDLKLDREPRVMQAMEAARLDILARAYAERQAESTGKPAPEDIQAYYDSKPVVFKERRVYALQELQVQAPADQLAALREKVQSAKSIGELTAYIKEKQLPVRVSQNSAAAEALPQGLAERLAAMKVGQAVFTGAPNGARILVVADARSAPMSLDQARPVIEQALMAERRRKTVETDLKALREASQIEYLGKFAEKPASSASAPAAASAKPASAAQDIDAALVNKGLAGLK